MPRSRLPLLVLIVTAFTATTLVQSPPGGAATGQPFDQYEQLKRQAERAVAEASFALALRLYEQADQLDLPTTETRWVDFRLGDCRWRSQAATRTSDQSEYDAARRQLQSVLDAVERESDRDVVWAEANASLGDFWWDRNDSRNWGQGWSHYQKALDFWAGSSDLEVARPRYLQIVRTMAEPSGSVQRGWFPGQVPTSILENALGLADAEEQAYFHYLIARTIQQQGGSWSQRSRVVEHFEAAIAGGPTSDWYDDALYRFGEWLSNQGRIVKMAHGQWRAEPDFPAAVKIYRRLLSEFRRGQSQYLDEARSRIEQITTPTIQVGVASIFLPDSEVQYALSWRNVERVELSLFPANLVRDVDATDHERFGDWSRLIDLRRLEPIRRWSIDTKDDGRHQPRTEAKRFDEPLPAGAYVLQATAGGKTARELVLVTDATLVIKSDAKRLVAFYADAISGEPVPDAEVRLWSGRWHDGRWALRDQTLRTGDDGLCVFEREQRKDDLPNTLHMIAAVAGDRQAIARVNTSRYAVSRAPWRIYAFTDRPAYRPGEQAQWKAIARRYENGEPFTPAGQSVKYKIVGPQGTTVSEGTLALNDFGSGWDAMELEESMRLGEYRITFSDAGGSTIGSAQLFRLEEYKLPEFKVSLDTRDADGRKRVHTIGDRVQVDVVAEYYFGGPVANATVEAVVYQKPFIHWWHAPRDYPWCYEPRPRNWWGPGQVVSRQTVRTDAAGRALVAFDTPEFANQDFEYRIEARVTDASRREIVGGDTLRVTRQRYYAYLQPERHLYEPRETVRIDVRTMDADSQPTMVTGQVTVTRQTWKEIWIAPDGRLVEGEPLERLRRVQQVFPPPTRGGQPGWRLKFRGYESEQILSRSVPTGEDGHGELTFQPPVDGYYSVAWRSPNTLDATGAMPDEEWGDWITAEAMVWVASDRTRFIGYHQGGVDLIIDRDTVEPGRDAAVMIATPTSGRHVLFTVEGSFLYEHRLVHVPGNARLIHVPITEAYIPNVYLGAMMVSDARLMADREELVVPPIEQYLDVTISTDRDAYEPRETGTLTVTTRDHDGRPVEAELSVALYDESVEYIQQDYAGDPRAFFFEQRQGLRVRTASTFDHRPYRRLEQEQELDEDQPAAGIGGAKEEMREAFRRDAMAPMAQAEGGIQDASFASAAATAAPSRSRRQKSGNFAADDESGAGSDPDAGGADGGPAVQVRSDFRSTLVWVPGIVTDADGTATVSVDYADSLTTWKAVTRAATTSDQFGIATTSTRTRKPLIARLQAPRFFVVGDRVTISAVVNNNTDEPIPATVTLDADGVEVLGVQRNGRLERGMDTLADVPAGQETRVDWIVRVQRPGPVTLAVGAQGGRHADGMTKTLVAHDHGIEQLIARSLKLRDGDEAVIHLDVPSQRRIESTSLEVQVAPSLAVTMLDALPYLIDYPYGCTEQTMSRFLPAAIVARTLRRLEVDPETAMSRVFGGIEAAAAPHVHPKGPRGLDTLDDIVNAGLARLADMQHGDGGWGWWKGGDSDRFMSAYVLWGLSLAKEAGVDVDAGMLQRGAAFVDTQLVQEEFDYDRQSWMLHALATYASATGRRDPGEHQRRALRNLLEHRDELNAYTRALLALAAKGYGDERGAQMLTRNMINGVSRDDTPDTSMILRDGRPHRDAGMATAHWGQDGVWWRWSEGAVESTAFALRALLAIDPSHELVEPATNWLIGNRRGAQWSNTRDTAITILALTDYLEASGELDKAVSYELQVNGQVVAEKTVTPQEALAAPSRFSIDRSLIVDGRNEIRIRRTDGKGPLYVSAEARFFSLEEPVPAAGNQMFVRRDYYRLAPRPTLLKGFVYDRVRLTDEDYVDSGDRVEVVLTIETKNDGEYLVFEDLKPAGLEAVAVRSGEGLQARELRADATRRVFAAPPADDARVDHRSDYTGRARWVHQELRDRKVAMFVDRMPQGVWEIRYELRAEVPGQFHALPLLGHAMYVPEIRANGDEIRLTVRDR